MSLQNVMFIIVYIHSEKFTKKMLLIHKNSHETINKKVGSRSLLLKVQFKQCTLNLISMIKFCLRKKLF